MVKNNTETCLVCGSDNAKLAEGTYDLAQDVIKVIEAESPSLEMLRAIGALAREHFVRGEEVEVTLGKVDAAWPSLALAFKKAQSKRSIQCVLGALAILYGSMGMANTVHDFWNNFGGVATAIYSAISRVIVEGEKGSGAHQSGVGDHKNVRVPNSQQQGGDGKPEDENRDASDNPGDITSV
jgi:hypothetical protein